MTALATGRPGASTISGGGSRATLLDLFGFIGKISGHPVIIDHQPPQKGDMHQWFLS